MAATYRTAKDRTPLAVSQTAARRFWDKVERRDTGSCWPWRGAIKEGGYGVFRLGRKLVPAHRLAFELLRGPIPDGLVTDHLCRVTTCVNPEHLEPVSPATNLRRGIRTRLTVEIVAEILRERLRGSPLREIAAKHGIGISHASRVVRGIRWAGVCEEAHS